MPHAADHHHDEMTVNLPDLGQGVFTIQISYCEPMTTDEILDTIYDIARRSGYPLFRA